MNETFKTLTTLITQTNPANFNNPQQLDQEEFYRLKTEIKVEVQNIRKTLVDVVFNLKEERQVEMYIQHHQRELIGLTDHLLGYLSMEEARNIYKISESRTLLNIHKYLYKHLEELLTYTEKHFSRYFSLKTKIPDSYRIMAMRDFQERLPLIEEELLNKSIDKELLEIIIKPLKSFTKGKFNDPISYRKLIYYKTMLKELGETVESRVEQEALNKEIISRFIYLNYNAYSFFCYFTTHIKSQYQKSGTLNNQLEKLAWFSKKIHQLREKPGYSYKPKDLSIKENITLWIEEEIAFLEKKYHISLSIPKGKQPQQNFAIQTNLSVSQLAYLIRLFVDAGIIRNESHRQLLQFFSTCIQTKKAQSISPGSLRNKFYNVEESTRQSLKDIIQNLFNQTAQPVGV